MGCFHVRDYWIWLLAAVYQVERGVCLPPFQEDSRVVGPDYSTWEDLGIIFSRKLVVELGHLCQSDGGCGQRVLCFLVAVVGYLSVLENHNKTYEARLHQSAASLESQQ